MVQLLYPHMTTGKNIALTIPFALTSLCWVFCHLQSAELSLCRVRKAQKAVSGARMECLPETLIWGWTSPRAVQEVPPWLLKRLRTSVCVCVCMHTHTHVRALLYAYLAHYSLSLPTPIPGLGLCDPWRSQYHLFNSPSFLGTCWEVPLGACGLCAKGRRGGLPGSPAEAPTHPVSSHRQLSRVLNGSLSG